MTALDLNINLLPPEIWERKKGERLVVVMSLALLVLCFLLVFVYLFNAFRITLARGELSQVKADNRKVEKEIEKLKPYADKKALIEKHEKTAETAMAGEVAWTKVFNELSMVIPGDIALTAFTADTEGKVTVEGYTPDYPADTPDLGHKPVGKWIGRFMEIKQLDDVWLKFSKKEDEDTDDEAGQRIEFELNARLAGVADEETDGKTTGASKATSGSSTTSDTGK